MKKGILIGLIAGMILMSLVTLTTNSTAPVGGSNREATWKQLKEVDDRGFSLASQSAGNCSEALNAFYKEDYDAVVRINKVNKELVGQVVNVSDQRQELLKKLGYK